MKHLQHIYKVRLFGFFFLALIAFIIPISYCSRSNDATGIKLGTISINSTGRAPLAGSNGKVSNEFPKGRTERGRQPSSKLGRPTGALGTQKDVALPYVPPEGEIRISPKDGTKLLQEVVNIEVKTWGLTFRPGLELGILPFGLGLDAKLFYLRRLSLTTGLFIGIGTHLDGNVYITSLSPISTLSYRLDRIPMLKNTEYFIGYAPLTRFQVVTGFRLSL